MSVRLLLVVAIILFVAAGLFARPAWGAAIVPDDYPTVTAAVASGADTIRVRDGFYDETVTISRALVLARLDPPGPPSATRPRITGLVTTGGVGTTAVVHVVRFQVDLPVQHLAPFAPGLDLWLDDCDLAGGITGPGTTSRLRVSGCRLAGDVVVYPYSLEFMDNSLMGAGLDANYEGWATITGNTFTGAPGAAIVLYDNDSEGRITDNEITDCGAGIHIDYPSGTRIERNRIEHCAGNGIEITHGPGAVVYVVDNVLRDLGGDGVDFGSLGGTAIGNTIEHVAGAGIRHDAPGMDLPRVAGNRITDTGQAGVLVLNDAAIRVFAGNTILRCYTSGAQLARVERADSNIVGRCGGHGIEVEGTLGAFGAAHNTLYLNGGSGLVVNSESAGAVEANIGYGNGLYALDWSGSGLATLACNLGMGNRAGNLRGAEGSDTDRDGDPLFCNLPADDVHLGPGSAAILAGCETAGALGPGCAASVGVGSGSPAAFLRAGPRPARASVRFEWSADGPARLEVFDALGAKRWERQLAAGQGALDWDLRDTRGRRLAPGVYFARSTSPLRTTTVKLVVAP